MSYRVFYRTCLSLGLVAASSVVSAAEHATQFQVHDSVHRADIIRGMTVKGTQNDVLGEIEDVVVNVQTGKVAYIALAHGGVLGVNETLFAIPADAFQLRQGDESDEYYLALPTNEAALKKMPSFPNDAWPSVADKAWVDKSMKIPGNDARAGEREGAEIDLQAGNTRVVIDFAREERSPKPAAEMKKAVVHRTSKIVGMTVKNPANKVLGSVKDVVIDLRRGEVRYLAVSYGGVLGLGDKLFAVPFHAFDCQPSDEAGEYFLVMDVDEQTLKNAPGFEEEEWPNFGDPRWSDKNDRHYPKRDRETRRNQTQLR